MYLTGYIKASTLSKNPKDEYLQKVTVKLGSSKAGADNIDASAAKDAVKKSWQAQIDNNSKASVSGSAWTLNKMVTDAVAANAADKTAEQAWYSTIAEKLMDETNMSGTDWKIVVTDIVAKSEDATKSYEAAKTVAGKVTIKYYLQSKSSSNKSDVSEKTLTIVARAEISKLDNLILANTAPLSNASGVYYITLADKTVTSSTDAATINAILKQAVYDTINSYPSQKEKTFYTDVTAENCSWTKNADGDYGLVVGTLTIKTDASDATEMNTTANGSIDSKTIFWVK